MIVSKFGGTSVGDAAAIRRLAGIVAARQPERPVVVVSALSKVTDALLDLERAPDHAAVAARLAALRDRHRTVATDLGLDGAATEQLERDLVALDAWVTPRIGHAWSAADRDFLVSHGELWSSRLVTAALAAQELPAVWFDARRVIATDSQFGQAVPNPAEIRRRAARLIAPILDGNEIPVTQGFIGSDEEGWTTTLGRGGSDYTASLLGAALDAARVEIWTDVDGILTADPRLVPDARRLPEASYHEAAELAAFGAKVLHPATQLPLVEAGIPCWVLNSFAPDREGTRIVAGARPAPITATSPVRSIAWKKGITVINVRAPRSFEAVGFLQQFFTIFARHGISVDVLASSEVNVSVTIDDAARLPALIADLESLGAVTVFDRRAIVAVVGVDLRGARGLSARLFNAVKDVNIEVISQGASEINITFVVKEEDAPTAVRALHREFFTAA